MCNSREALRPVLSLCIVMSVCTDGGAAMAQRLRRDSLYHLKEVVVMGTRDVSPHQTITRGQIETLPSSSVADALKYLAGVQIKDYGGLGGQKTINVRSLGSQHVGVYLDGVRITNAQNGTVDLGKYSLSTLESVSLFNANKAESLMTASEYASASTVYMKTHRPDSSAAVLHYTYGSFGTHKAGATVSYRDRGFIDAAFTHSDGDYPFDYHTEYEDTTGTRRNSDITMFRIESCLFHKGLQWHTYYFNSRRGLPGGVVRRLSDAYTDVGREWDSNFFSQLSYRQDYGAFGVRGIVKYANDYLHYRSDYPENISVHANNRYHQQDIYTALAGSYTKGAFGTSVSSDLRWSDLTTDVRGFHYVYRLDSKTSLSAFYNHKGVSASLSGLYTSIADHTHGGTKPLSRFTWNALASYTYGPWTLRSFYKTVFRAPTLNDLYYTLVGNRNLKPEYTKQFDIGMTYSNGWIDLQADWYYNHVEDRIVCLPLKGSYQWTMLNYGYTRCMGVDITANATFLKHHSLLLTVTFQDDRNRTDPTEDAYNDYIAYSPRWSLTAVYTLLYRGLSASLSHIFVDRRYWTAENAIEDPLTAYNCTDLKVGYRYRSATIEAECQDLFDTRYELIQRWPMPGRRYAITIKYQL
ncbi:MAG: TonB-dependent receptor [Prevotellaceae bacterium]|nr:TonB-dependent receptor [Prevotellaceae bacterium]